MTILEQLAADRVERDARIASKRLMLGHWAFTDLLGAFEALKYLCKGEPHWARDDLIQLVDLAQAEAAAEEADRSAARLCSGIGGRRLAGNVPAVDTVGASALDAKVGRLRT